MTTKKVNKGTYTPEQEKQLVELWGNSDSLPVDERKDVLESISKVMDKSVRSLQLKLSKLGKYTAISKRQENQPSEKKEDIVEEINLFMAGGFNSVEAESLTKANKSALQKILDRLNKGNPSQESEAEENAA